MKRSKTYFNHFDSECDKSHRDFEKKKKNKNN